MTGANKAQKVKVLDQLPYICYLVQFQNNNSKDILDLLNSKSKINAMTLAYVAQLGLKVQKINIGF